MNQLKQLFLYLTYECNMKCKHCWVYTVKERGDSLSESIWKRVIEEAESLGLHLLKFTGGEPFLKKQLLFNLIDMDVEFNIETNGTLLNESDVKYLSQSKIKEIGVSIDFPDPQRFEAFRGLPKSFEKVTRTIWLLHEYNIPVVAIMSVFQGNLNDIPAVAERVFNLGADKLKVHPVMAMGKAIEFRDHLLLPSEYIKLAHTLEKLMELYPGKIGTSLPWVLIADFSPEYMNITRTLCNYKNLLTILPNGDISLCGIGMTHPSTVLGNISQVNLSDIWENEPELLNKLHTMDPLHIEGICGRCVFRKYCANMCPAYVYEIHGTFTNSYPLCEELEATGVFPRKYLVDP